jgi:spermidine synthase
MNQPTRKSVTARQQADKSHPEIWRQGDRSLSGLQLCFFLSGAAGLIYQVAWTKALGQLFGYSAYAVATVLAVFMGGMALGSALFSRWRPGRKSGIALYAWMEFGIALTALLSLPGIAMVRQIYLAAYPHAGGSFALRFLGAAVILALPALLMGGTLPVLLAGLSRNVSELGIRAGRFYAVNTAGAVAGTVAAGFFLIPWFGLRLTVATAVVLNLAAGFLSQNIAAADRTPPAEISVDVSAGTKPLFLVCFAGVGATAIAYELGWTRLLLTPLGSSTYAFSLMLATFLLGISIGSAIFEKWFRAKRSSSSNLFAVTQFGIAAAILLFLWSFHEIPEVLLALLRIFGDRFPALLAAQALTCALAMLPATILFGFNFPAVLALVSDGDTGNQTTHFSRRIGQAVAANTLGAILAALIGGFLLLPRIGSFRLVAAAACVNIAIGVVVFPNANRRNFRPLAVAVALLVAIGWTVWSPGFSSQTTASFGVVLYSDYHGSGLTAREMADTEDVVFFKDGISATIAVTRSENYIALKTNGKVDASNLDRGTQLLLGALGAVFHPHPRKVLIIGFGGGMTASVVSRFPEVERIDCVEIEPAVLEAAKHLERLNRGVLSDPRLHVHFDDARNFLQTSREQYDLIISEPSNPWIAGIASLYTSEFFGVVRSHLAPGGNFVQWIQAYGLKFDDFRMILGGFSKKFGDLTLWHSSGRDFLVLARDSSEPFSFDRSRALWNNELLRQDFAALHLTKAESWPIYFRLNNAAIDLLTSHAERNTDDQTRLEYSAPENLRKDSLTTELDAAIGGFEKSPLPEGLSAYDAELAAVGAAESALEVSPTRANQYLSQLKGRQETEIEVLRARAHIGVQEFSAAASILGALHRAESNRYNSSYWLAIAQRGLGLSEDAKATLDGLLRLEPQNQQALEARIALATEQKSYASAAELQVRLASLRPESAQEQCRLGDLYLRSANLAAAEAPLQKGLELDPYTFLCRRDRGELYRATGRNADALKDLEWVVHYFPEGDPKTYLSLALAYQVAGNRERAEAALAKGKRMFPADPLLRKFTLKND